MRNLHIPLRGTASALLLLSLLSPVAAQTVKIGVILTLSGPNSEPGLQLDKGINLYVQEHERDLPAGVKVALVRRDDTGPNPEVAKRLAQELVTRDHVQFLAGVVYSPNAVAIAPITAEAKLPLVIMSAAGSAITRMSPYIVRVSDTLWQTSYPMGQWTVQQGMKKAYTVVSDYIPGYDAEGGFIKAFKAGGGDIVGSIRLPLAEVDFVPFLQRVKDAKPEVAFLFTPGGKQSSTLMRAWTDLGITAAGVKLVTTQDVVSDELLPSMGDVTLGVVSAGVYSPVAARPQNTAFLRAWTKVYGADAVPNYNVVFAWDGMAAIFDVIKQTKGTFTADQAMEILKNWKNPDSPRGPIMIDPETRDIVQNVYIRRVEKQKGILSNVEFATVPQVKDPWKEFNPPQHQ
ncbi:MAG TPA: ABC transporter substrate-binding protein [Stellaceae bacterium]|nr:ABC transporter substrate-binding protein [Stellaceae bacterium]